MKRLRALITADMGQEFTAYCDVGGNSYKISNRPLRRTEVKKKDLLRLKMLYPEAFQSCVTDTEYRMFRVSQNNAEAA